MRDASVLLLVLILTHMGLDYGASVWRGKGWQPKGAWLSLVTVAAYTLVVGGIVFLFGYSLFGHNALFSLFSLLAGFTVGTCWAVTRWLIARLIWKFAFALRYAINLVVVSAVWLTVEDRWLWMWEFSKGLVSSHNLLVLLGYILVLRPTSVLIGSILSPWLPLVNTQGSLKSAGKLIGYLERTLILTFVLLGQWEAIGFLLTAKSILRFNDIKGVEQRALSEYVLLGTLLSFTTSIAIGLAVAKLSAI